MQMRSVISGVVQVMTDKLKPAHIMYAEPEPVHVMHNQQKSVSSDKMTASPVSSDKVSGVVFVIRRYTPYRPTRKKSRIPVYPLKKV